jgi:hypothetical protein
MKKLKFLFLALLISGNALKSSGQSKKFINALSIGGSAMKITDSFKWKDEKESIWDFNSNIELQFKTRYRIGYNRYHYLQKIKGVRSPYMYLNQPYFQYDLFRKSTKFRIFLEAAYYFGNYCDCAAEYPFPKKGKKYWGLGAGLELRIWYRFYFEYSYVSISHFKLPAPDVARSPTGNVTLGINYRQPLQNE